MVDASGNRVVTLPMAGQEPATPEKFVCLDSRIGFTPQVSPRLTCLGLHLIVFHGGTNTGPAQDGGLKGGVTQIIVFEWPTELRNLLKHIILYQEWVGKETPVRAAISLLSSKL